MKTIRPIILLLILFASLDLSGQEGKPTKTIEIDPALSTQFYNDCMRDSQDPEVSRAEKVCKDESSDPDLMKYHGKLGETGKLVPFTDADRAAAYAHCIGSPFGDFTDPVIIDQCKKEAVDDLEVHVFLSNPVRKVRKVFVGSFHGSKKIKEAIRDTCIQVADSVEQSDAILTDVARVAEYQPGEDYNVLCTSNSASVKCSDGVTTDTTSCGPFGNCISISRHNTFRTLGLLDSRTRKELDWIEPGVSSPKPSEIAESLSKTVGCGKEK
jgi:hypothetical protein